MDLVLCTCGKYISGFRYMKHQLGLVRLHNILVDKIHNKINEGKYRPSYLEV